jgi:hypothetical protein
MLQAMKEEPPLNAKCKDKFLIQSMLIPPEKAAIPLHDLVRPFLHIPVPYLTFLVVDYTRGGGARKGSLPESEGQLSPPRRPPARRGR